MKRAILCLIASLSLFVGIVSAQWKQEFFPEYATCSKVSVTTYSFTALFTADYAQYEAYLIAEMPIYITTFTYTLVQNKVIDAYIQSGSSVAAKFPICTGLINNGRPPMHIFTAQPLYLLSTATACSEAWLLKLRRR